MLLLASCGGGDPDSDPPPPPASGTPVLAANYTDVVEGTTLGQPNWPDGSGNGQPIDGVGCAASENYHIHAMVSIYRNGTRLAVPGHIGLNGCTYELHTHDAAGIVHVETNVQKTFTFGQFFEVWNQPLGASNVGGIAGAAKFYVIENEKVTPVDHPEDVELGEHRELAIVIGTPPAALAKHRWPNSL
jgi:hypothetical protein